MLKPQDILVLLKLISVDQPYATFSWLGKELAMSASEVHQACQRTAEVRLLAYIQEGRQKKRIVNRRGLEEFLTHGLKYVFPPKRGKETMGIPTSYGAPFFPPQSAQEQLPPVWPHPDGEVRGVEFAPIYRSAPKAALKDSKLYELLAIVDAIRGRQAGVRAVAIGELQARLKR